MGPSGPAVLLGHPPVGADVLRLNAASSAWAERASSSPNAYQRSPPHVRPWPATACGRERTYQLLEP